MKWLKLLVISIVFTLVSNVCFAEEFPFRKDYPNVPIIELTDLKAGYDNGSIVIVDVRSTLEFDTIHPKGASHVMLSSANFEKNLQSFSEQNSGKKIAVYCNGITCLKSYNATQKALDAGVKDVYAFDAGIPAWAKTYPADTLLVGKPVTDPEKQLIPKSEFKKRTIDFKTFKEKATASNAKVIDARDPMQRTQKFTEFNDILPIPLDKLIKNIINNDRMKDKQLLIIDQVGKQVRWLMYYLEDKGYKDYYFLKGGATSVFKEQKYR
jgi:rhodanese-related sulfurtransferase